MQISKTGLIKYEDGYLTISHYKEPLKPVSEGFGYEGCLLMTLDGKGVQCHICGKTFGDLSMHLRGTHKMKADEYREKFQLAQSTSLISEEIRENRKLATLKWMKEMEEKHGIDWRKTLKKNSVKGHLTKKTGHGQEISLETKNKRGTCPDQLLDRIKIVTEQLGHVPTKKEFIETTGSQRYVHLIYKTFGSWLNAVRKAGLQPKERNLNRHYEDNELLEFLRDFYIQNGKIPTHSDSRRGFIPTGDTYDKRFGSLPKARELAGILENPRHNSKKMYATH